MREESTVNPESQAPWTGAELFAVLFLVWFFWPSTLYLLLQGMGFERWYYGEAAAEVQTRVQLWVRTLALPFQAVTMPLVFAAVSGTRPEQLGLTTRRFGRNVLAGLIATAAITPVVYGIYYLSQQLYAHWGTGLEKHPLEVLGEQHLFVSEWILLIFTAIAAAPLLEELTFRGVLQPWLAATRWRSHAAMLAALLLTLWSRHERLMTGWHHGIGPMAEEAAPVLFVLALEPIFLLVCWRSRSPLAPAIFAASLLFACVHMLVWPTPVPLFVMGLGLGALAARTQSLVGPIVLHSLFNGISCVKLLFFD